MFEIMKREVNDFYVERKLHGKLTPCSGYFWTLKCVAMVTKFRISKELSVKR